MITNFETITEQLTARESEYVPWLVTLFKANVELPLTNKEIIYVASMNSMKLTEPRVRKIINYIRMKGLVKNLIATSKGYYITEDQTEIKKYILSLAERIDAITAIKNSFTTDGQVSKS